MTFLRSARKAGPSPSAVAERPRTFTNTRAMALATALVLLLVLGTSSDAFAAKGDIAGAGQNIADTLSTWAAALFGGVTGIMAIYYVANRKIGPALGFVALAMLVGGFVFAPDLMGNSAKSVAQTVLK